MDSIFFNTHHSPIGAFASFTLGYPGAKGGLGLELTGPADQNVFIGVESRDDARVFESLPFFEGSDDDSKRYDVEANEDDEMGPKAVVKPFEMDAITRSFGPAIDTWQAGDMTFRILSPVRSVPDPALGDEAAIKAAICPAVIAEMVIDNTEGDRQRKAFFGYVGNDPYYAMRRLDDRDDQLGFRGVGQGRNTAIATDDPDAYSGQGFTMAHVLAPTVAENITHGIPGTAGLVVPVPAGQTRTIRFAICFHRDGIATSGESTRYLYTRYFDTIESVAGYALEQFDQFVSSASEADVAMTSDYLSDDQNFMLAHAIRSYFGSTQLLEWLGGKHDGQPYWVVNEGEYRMMNTFDLTADMIFFEMKMNPWTMRNVLEMFIDRYSYHDQAHLPGDDTLHPGGISFTHDQGVSCQISRAAYSTYELFGLDGCFSHMTHEQLVNWVCCASLYVRGAKDDAWFAERKSVFLDCLESLLNRDHPDPEQRNGIMGLDSSRCLGGTEITTYDSLDQSLGQARNNLYMAVKTWAAYVALWKLFEDAGEADAAATAHEQAKRCAATLVSQADDDGLLPAVMFENVDSRIIPAIEGLAFPHRCGWTDVTAADGPFGDLIAALKTHVQKVVGDGICRFKDRGWKLSSTSDNSWLSKIYLSQYVWRKVFGLEWGDDGAAADRAHVGWLLDDDSRYFAWSDQMVSGIARGSKYYPRGVTSILWLEE